MQRYKELINANSEDVDFSKSTIYIIYCLDECIKGCYIGSTVNFQARKKQHINCCLTKTDKRYNQRIYKIIREAGGWNNWKIGILERMPQCKNKKELLGREIFYIAKTPECVNINMPIRTAYIKNFNVKTEVNKPLDNIITTINKNDFIQQTVKSVIYDMIIEIEKNDITALKKQTNKENRKAKSNEKGTCDLCKGKYTLKNKAIHYKTSKHIKVLSNHG